MHKMSIEGSSLPPYFWTKKYSIFALLLAARQQKKSCNKRKRSNLRNSNTVQVRSFMFFKKIW